MNFIFLKVILILLLKEISNSLNYKKKKINKYKINLYKISLVMDLILS